MFFTRFRFHPFLKLILAIALTTGWLCAAPYGPDGLPIEWTQPDGSKLTLRVFGDEFHGRTETLDGYTVVYDPADNAYHYAKLSNDGQKLMASGRRVNGKAPAGSAKHLRLPPEAARAIWKERYAKLAPNERANWARRVEAARQRKGLDAGEPAPKPVSGGGAATQASAAAFAPVTGGYVGLTILVQFPDDPATVPVDPTNFPTTKANMENYCNQIGYTGGGNSGSVRDYFLAQSVNQTDYTQVVTEIVTLPQPRAYYNWANYPTNTTIRDGGLTGRLVLNDAITILKAQGFDFTGLTRDGSNRVVATNVLFAGATSGVWPDGLWPHRWVMSPQVNVGTVGNPIYIYDYQITNAQTASVPIGTFCHENGHLLLKFPDLYDYGGESEGVGNHCLMGAGNHNNGGKTPAPINGYFKDVSGWSNVVDITTSQFFTDSLPTTNNEGYRIRKPGTSTEYFLIENRGNGDPWAASVPDKGMIIWHIDEAVSGNDNEQMTSSQHYEVSVEQADGFFDLENGSDRGDSTDLFDSSHTQGFSDTTTPDAKWWNGSSSGIRLAFLSAAGASMNVQFGLPANSVQVTYPNGGESIYFGTAPDITWAANITGNVKIELFKGGSLHSVLSANQPNDGSYAWSVSAGLPAGNDYTIKISSAATPAYTDSSNATFSILVNPLAAALDTTGLTWTSSGNAGWLPQSTTTHDGVDAAQSGVIADNQNSYMETLVTGPGTLTFWWKVSSEVNYDYLRFYLDGTEQTGPLARISGTVDWVQKTVSISSGNHTVKWGYTKDINVVAGSDAAWVDQVVYTPSAAPEIAVEQPVGTNLVDGSASIDCGAINPGSSSPPSTFTVKNTGTADLTGLFLTKDGTHNADYTLGSLGATTLSPGTSTTFTVTFTPGASGTRTAAIHLASSDADENPFDIALTGTGIPLGTLSVTAGNFTSAGSYGGPFSPASKAYTLTNIGSTPIDWTAAKTAAWVTLDAISGTLAAGANATVTVSCTANALAVGGYSDTVTFTNTTNSNGNTTRDVALTVNPIAATFNFSNLLQTYDGTPKPATVTTTPPGLVYSVTYAGSSTAPTNAGTYAVVATIAEPNYSGSGSGSLTINKAAQTITFDALTPVLDTASPFALGATASSGLGVSYISSNTAVATFSGSTVTIVGLGTTTITASQTGDTNYNAAGSVPQILTVVRASPLAVAGGPYKVLIGQSLSLNGSASQPSYGETLSTYEWDLNNDATFGDATGATPSAISFATLAGSWGMVQGLNTIQLKVTDSANKTSIVATTVELVLSLTWDANGTIAGQTNGAGAWLDANKWWDGAANQTWSAGSNATFGGPNTAGGAVTLDSPTTVNALTFNQFTGTYTLGTAGQALTINGGINKTATAGAVSLTASPIVLGAAQTWTNNSAGAFTVNVAADNGGNLLTFDGSGTTTFGSATGIISGAGGLTMNGSGRLFLGSGAVPVHTYEGTTTLNSGVTMVSNNNLGPGNLTMNGGVLESYWNTNFIRGLGSANGLVQLIGGASGLALNGNTAMSVILGNNAANEAVWGAANEAGNANATGFFNPSIFVLQTPFSQGTSSVNFQNKIDLNGSSRTIQVSGGVAGTATATLSGIIRTSSGTAGIVKTGNGQLNLSAPNTYNGVTTISAGPIAISNATSLGTTAGNTTIAATGSSNGAQLKISNNINCVENITITGTSEANSYVAAIANTGGTNTLSGNIILSGITGEIRLGAASGSLTFSGTISQITSTDSLAFIASNGASVTANNAIANNGGALSIYNTTQTTGTGTVTLKGVSGSGIGETYIWQTGILKLGVTNALNTTANLNLGAVTTTAGFDTGTFDLAGYNQTVNALIGSKNTGNVAADTARRVTNSVAGTGTNVLTVGNGDGSGIFNGVIVDGATAKVALTKAGNGTQTLAGPSTYTGATTITGGTLALGGIDVLPNTTAVSIASATLDAATFTDATGTLDVTSTATINLGTGAALAFADSSAIDWTGGTLNLTGTFVSGASLRFGTSSTGLTLTQLAKISATGLGPFFLNPDGYLIVDTTAPTLAASAIVDDQGGGAVTVGTLVTYTVNFSEDMDASTVTATDFGNAGSATVAIGSVTETTPGVFGVQATPTTTGTLQLRVNAGAVLKDMVGNNLDTTAAIADNTTLTVQTPYATWSGGAAFDADANSDGVANGMSWLLGAANPTANAIGLLPTFDNTTDPDFFIYSYRRSDAANTDANTTIAVEYASQLGAWTTAVHDGTNIIIIAANDGAGAGIDEVTVKIRRTLAVDAKLFARLRVGVTDP